MKVITAVAAALLSIAGCSKEEPAAAEIPAAPVPAAAAEPAPAPVADEATKEIDALAQEIEADLAEEG